MFKDCHCCKESKYAMNPVGGTGPRNALVAVLGRNPGTTENLQDKPFVGSGGQELIKGLMLAHIFIRSCYLTNLVKCYTPAGITPSRFCRKTCTDLWLNKELQKLTKLKLVITLGNEALNYFEPYGSVEELHGTALYVTKPWQRNEKVMIFITYHPSVVFYENGKKFNKDMEALRFFLEEQTRGKELIHA